MKSKIIVLGRSGQVATELAALGCACFGRERADLETPGVAADLIAANTPRAVINAAAYTAIDRAEGEEALAMRINGAAVGEVAQACASLGVPLVHISTDYVFDGRGETPWQPDDPTAPLGAYGRSKLAGEEAVRHAGGVHAILRTSWVFSAQGANFVKTMLRLGAERDALRIVTDQWGGPTPARDIARACLTMAERLTPETTGTYHFAGQPTTTWAGFAEEIFAAASMQVDVTPILSEDFPTPASRPKNSRLNCTSLEAAFGITPPDWKAGLTATLKELGHGA